MVEMCLCMHMTRCCKPFTCDRISVSLGFQIYSTFILIFYFNFIELLINSPFFFYVGFDQFNKKTRCSTSLQFNKNQF